MGSKVLDVKDGNFEAEVLRSDLPVLLDFSAEWCGPCRTLAPIMEEIASEFEGKAKVATMDVGLAQETAVRLGVKAVPTLVFFKDGKVQEKLVGPAQKSVVIARLQRLL